MPVLHINGLRCKLTATEAAIWRAVFISHPVSMCAGTLTRVMWPEAALPPATWRQGIATHLCRLRRALRGTGVSVENIAPFRYAMVTESRSSCPPTTEREGGGDGTPSAIPAAHSSHPPRQPADLGQQHQRSGKHQHTIPERRFCPAASRQPIEGLRVRHAPKMQEQTP